MPGPDEADHRADRVWSFDVDVPLHVRQCVEEVAKAGESAPVEKIDAVDLRRGKVPDEMRDSGDPVEVCVVGGEEDAVGRGVDIGLHPVHTGPSRGREGGRVFSLVSGQRPPRCAMTSGWEFIPQS